MSCVLVLSAICLTPAPSGAEELKGELTWPADADARAIRLLNLYTAYCVSFALDDDARLEALNGSGLKPVDGSAYEYIGDDAGQTWSATDATGEFVIRVKDMQGCTVYAREVSIADAERLFAYMSQNLPDWLLPPLIKYRDAWSANRLNHQISYRADVPGSNIYVNVTLMTMASPTARAHAFANVVRVRRD